MRKEESVKRFLIGLAAIAASAALIVGCAGTPKSAAQQFKAGSYRATAYGNLSNVTVEVTFTESAIAEVKVLEQNETPVLWAPVAAKIPVEIVKGQTLAVDVVTGSSNSSKAILKAVADCVEQAGGDPKALMAQQAKKAGSSMEYSADVVVVGAGASGFMAANNAAMGGAKVIAIEKGPSVAATNGIKVSGPFAVDTPTLKEKGTTLTVDDVFYHVMTYTHWVPNASLLRNCLETSKTAVSQLMDFGYKFKEVNFRFATPFIGEKGGFHLILNPMEERVSVWEKAFKTNGIEVLYETSGKELLKENGRVTGVVAYKSDGTKVTIKAKAVILATGGYLGNKDMLLDRLGTTHVNVAAGGDSLCTGDGIKMAVAAGAGLDKTWGLCGSEYGGTNAKATRPAKQDKYDQNTAFKFGVYGSLLVDAQGKRFMNEGMMCDFPMSFGSEPLLRNTPYYAIVDSAYVDAMATKGLYEYTTARGATAENWFIGAYFKGRVLKDIYKDLEEGIKEGWCYKADTVEELAEFFGLESLPATVAQYNKYCEAGADPQFGAAKWYLSPIKQGPFYVTQNEVSAWSTFGGVRTDDACRAVGADQKAIPGLYVVGTDNGSLYSSPYYDVPGFCYGLCVDSGVIAGKAAAEFSKTAL